MCYILNKTNIINIRLDSVESMHACLLEQAPDLVSGYHNHTCYLGYLHARPGRDRMFGRPPSEQADVVRKGQILLALLHLRESQIKLMF